MISSNKKTPLHIMVHDTIKNRLVSGELLPGERVVESKIAKELGVSSSPVREGLRMLEQERMLLLTPTGLVVNPMEMEEMADVHECRMALEPVTARLAAERIDDATLEKLQEYIDLSREYHRTEEYARIVETNSAFHTTIIMSSENKHLIHMNDTISSLMLMCRVSEFQFYHRSDEYLDEHQMIHDALAQRDGEKVENILRVHTRKDYDLYKKIFASRNKIFR